MSDATQGNILLLDDDNFLLDMYSMKFVKEGFTVQSCFSVAEALEALRKGFLPDAVVFDIVMPGQDGFAFLEALKSEKLASSAVKIALTNQSSDAEKTKAMELGADKFVVKATMIPSEVVNTVREAITGRSREKAVQ